MSSYYEHYSYVSIKKKYISILDTSYAINNQNVLDVIYTLYCLKNFNNKIINFNTNIHYHYYKTFIYFYLFLFFNFIKK